ncbi:MAG: EAL domain-containing protein, partial [Cyanobacteria bacterium P01_H01_bin.153]
MADHQSVITQWTDHWNQFDQSQLPIQLLNAVNQAVMAIDVEGDIRFWNRAAAMLYGWEQDEILGQSILDLAPVLGLRLPIAKIMAVIRRGQPWTKEMTVRDRYQRDFTALVNVAPIYNSENYLVGLIGVSSDISRFKATQAQLIQQTQQEQALARVVDAIHQSLDLDTIFSVSVTHIARLLKARVAIMQYFPDRHYWMSRVVFDIEQELIQTPHDVAPDAHNPLAEKLKRLEVVKINDISSITDPVNSEFAKKNPGTWLLIPISLDGRAWGSLTLCRRPNQTGWRDEDVELAQQVATQLAIAIAKAQSCQQLQQELIFRRSNEDQLRQYERIVSATLDGIALLDTDYIYRAVNQTYLDWHHKKREDIVGHSVADLLGENIFHSLVKPKLDQCLQGDVVRHSDWFAYDADKQHYLNVTYAPFFDDGHELCGVVVTSRDMTDLQLAQEALQRQAEQERAVNDIVRLVRQSFEIESLFPQTLAAISRLLDADHGAIAKFEEGDQTWHYIAEHRANETILPCVGLRLSDAQNPAAAILKQGQTVCVDDSTRLTDQLHRELAKLFPGAWLIVPLRVQDGTWGSLTLRKLKPNWMPEATGLCVRIADQLAIGIHQAALFQAAHAELQKRQQAEQMLRNQESFFRSLYEQATLGIAFCNSAGQILQVNAKYCAITGYSERELQSMSLNQFTHPSDRYLNQAIFLEVARAERSEFSTDKRYVRRDGTTVWVHLTASVIRDEQGQFKVLAAIIQDISDRKQLEAERQQAEAQLRHNALHDTLTQLPNRNLLMTQLGRALVRMQRPPHQQFAVLFLDLDRFKLVNDSLGHLAGDQLLVMVAQILNRLVRPGDLVARIGGDEFVILLEAIDDTSEVLTVAERLLQTLRQPLQLEQREVFATASMGIVLGALTYRSATELLRDADIAMYRAKANGKNGYALFDPALHKRVTYRLQLEQDLRRAIVQQQLELYYQPIVSLRDGAIFCLETLTRWQHPEHGLIPPSDFIPIAEETGLIAGLDQWAVRTACRQLKEWQVQYPAAENLKVSVNLSAQDLHVPHLVDWITRALSESDLAGEHLILEITESLLVSDTPQILQLIGQIQDLSVRLAVDDFGTGYSSLSYLHRFPLGALKIDQSFTSNMQLGSVNQEIIETIVAL